MRIELHQQDDTVSIEERQSFCEFLEHIGNGTYPEQKVCDSGVMVKLPESILSQQQSIDGFVSEIYPDLAQHVGNGCYFRSRAILTPLNADVDILNESILSQMPGWFLSPLLLHGT